MEARLEAKEGGPSVIIKMSTLDSYKEGFAASAGDDLFLTYHHIASDKTLSSKSYSRSEFWKLARRAANILKKHQVVEGCHFAHYFTDNRPEDLAFRLAATMVGAVPVTINWQADTVDRIAYKLDLAEATLMLIDDGVSDEQLSDIRRKLEREIVVLNISDLEGAVELEESSFTPFSSASSTRIVIFTSGTTGQPKGVRLSYSAYRTNRATFEKFLQCEDPDISLTTVIVNPLHHANSTSFTDWCLQRPGAQVHLLQRYTTNYWKLLTDVSSSRTKKMHRIVAPAVSRHFDFLESLAQQGRRCILPAIAN